MSTLICPVVLTWVQFAARRHPVFAVRRDFLGCLLVFLILPCVQLIDRTSVSEVFFLSPVCQLSITALMTSCIHIDRTQTVRRFDDARFCLVFSPKSICLFTHLALGYVMAAVTNLWWVASQNKRQFLCGFTSDSCAKHLKMTRYISHLWFSSFDRIFRVFSHWNLRKFVQKSSRFQNCVLSKWLLWLNLIMVNSRTACWHLLLQKVTHFGVENRTKINVYLESNDIGSISRCSSTFLPSFNA